MASRLDSDALIAIRRLRRQLTVWRLLTVAVFAFAVILLLREQQVLADKDHVARVSVQGVIVDDRDLIDMIDAVADDPSARALVVEISSPGGTFTGGENLYRSLRRVAEQKPVVAVMGGVATSGAYMAAIGADRIYAGHGTITGSIGVIMQTADVTGLLDKLGIRPETVKSGALKATPNPLERLDERARRQLQGVIDALHTRFVEMVASRRGMSVSTVLERTGDGRVMTGSAAVEAGLVDAIGDIQSARLWLASSRDIDEDLPLLDWELEDPFEWWHDAAAGIFSGALEKSLMPERLTLDGIQALWHPFDRGAQ